MTTIPAPTSDPGRPGPLRAVHENLGGLCRRPRGDAGMTTAEYAVGTVAACAFAAILYQVVTGQSVVAALGALIQSALSSLS